MPGISIITSLPRFVSQEQHLELTSTTPASFSELPAVLYHEEQNASITLDPPLDGLTEQECSSGTVYALSSHLIFWSAAGKGLQVTYPTISLHAISRAELGPSIYCQLDETLDGEDEPTPDEEDAMEMRELRLNVQSEASLEPLFEALSRCAALNPDEHNEEEDEFDDAFLDENEMENAEFVTEEQGELSEAGRATLARLETILVDPHGHLPADSDEEAGEGGSDQNPHLTNGISR